MLVFPPSCSVCAVIERVHRVPISLLSLGVTNSRALSDIPVLWSVPRVSAWQVRRSPLIGTTSFVSPHGDFCRKDFVFLIKYVRIEDVLNL